MKWPGHRAVHVPRHLGAISAVAPDEQGASLGPAGQKRLWDSVRDLYRTGAYPAITVCIRHRGAVVLHRAIGHASGNGPDDPLHGAKRLVRPDTPICVFSASKAITALLIHKLAEEGGIRLDERVSHFIPEFAAHGKGRTTISEVLSHRGGFPMFDLPGGPVDPLMLLDWERCIALICSAPPVHRGGPRLSYHAITGGFILAEILQRVTQRPIAEYLDSKFRQPMGMRTFTYGLAPEWRGTEARNYMAGAPVRYPISRLLERALIVPMEQVVEISNSDVFLDAVVPAGNLYCTAEELSRFYQMLLDGGRWGDRQLLKPETVARAVRPACKLAFDHTLKIPMRYSEGLMLGANPFGLFGPMTGQAYGHLGFMNILGWADPSRELAASLLVTGKAVLGGHLLALGQFLTTLAWQFRRRGPFG